MYICDYLLALFLERIGFGLQFLFDVGVMFLQYVTVFALFDATQGVGQCTAL